MPLSMDLHNLETDIVSAILRLLWFQA